MIFHGRVWVRQRPGRDARTKGKGRDPPAAAPACASRSMPLNGPRCRIGNVNPPSPSSQQQPFAVVVARVHAWAADWLAVRQFHPSPRARRHHTAPGGVRCVLASRSVLLASWVVTCRVWASTAADTDGAGGCAVRASKPTPATGYGGRRFHPHACLTNGPRPGRRGGDDGGRSSSSSCWPHPSLG